MTVDFSLPLDVAVFVDNASIHRYKPCQELCKERRVPYIFNEPGRPEHMGVEYIWAHCKKLFRNELRDALAYDRDINLKERVLHIVENIPNELCMKCCRHGLGVLMKSKPVAPVPDDADTGKTMISEEFLDRILGKKSRLED